MCLLPPTERTDREESEEAEEIQVMQISVINKAYKRKIEAETNGRRSVDGLRKERKRGS